MAILSYASGFGASRMQSFCGPDVGFFSIGDCTFGKLYQLITTFNVCTLTKTKASRNMVCGYTKGKKNVMGFLASQILDE